MAIMPVVGAVIIGSIALIIVNRLMSVRIFSRFVVIGSNCFM